MPRAFTPRGKNRDLRNQLRKRLASPPAVSPTLSYDGGSIYLAFNPPMLVRSLPLVQRSTDAVNWLSAPIQAIINTPSPDKTGTAIQTQITITGGIGPYYYRIAANDPAYRTPQGGGITAIAFNNNT